MIMTWKSLISRVSSFMEDINKRGRFFLSLSKLECDSQEISSREIHLHFIFSAKWKKPDKVWKNAISSDVFAAVAVVDKQCLIFTICTPPPPPESSLLPRLTGPLTGREAFGTCHVLGLWDDGDIVDMIEAVVTRVDASQLSSHI